MNTVAGTDGDSARYGFSFSWETGFGHAVKLVAELAPGAIVLDLGCGYAPVAEVLTAEVGCTYVGADIDADALADLGARGFEAHRIDLADTGHLAETIEGIAGGRSIGAVLVLDVIEHLTDTVGLLSQLHSACRFLGDPLLVVSVPNIAHADLGIKLLSGRWEMTDTGLMDFTHVRFFTAARLARMMEAAGFAEVGALDVEIESTEQAGFPPGDPALIPQVPLHTYLRSLRDTADGFGSTFQLVRAYRAVVRGPLPAGEPCTEIDFDMETPGTAGPLLSIMIPHAGGGASAAASVASRDSCRDAEEAGAQIVEVEAASLAEAVHRGFAEASGRYVCILMPGWTLAPGWKTALEDAAGPEPRVIRAVGPPIGSPAFDIIEHFRRNATPPATVAIPRSVVVGRGLTFTPEDEESGGWAFVTAACLMCGVTDIGRALVQLPEGDSTAPAGPEPADPEVRRRHLAPLESAGVLMPAGIASFLGELGDELQHLREQAPGLWHQIYRIADERDQARASLDEESDERRKAQIEIIGLRDEMAAMRASTSWKVTAPIRKATGAIARLRRRRT